MKDKIISPSVPKRENLKAVYDLLNSFCKNPNLFYSKDEVKKLKNDKSNIFL